MCAEIESLYDTYNLFGETTTRRSKLNRYYRQNAFRVLTENKFCDDWLFNHALLSAGKMKMKEVILSELGRIEKDESIIEVAKFICDNKLSTKESVNLIRRFRNTKKAKPDETNLANKIIKVINDYLKFNPDSNIDEVQNAIQIVLQQIKE